MKEQLKGTLFIIAAMIIFGFMGVFVRFLSLPSHVILFFDFLFLSIMLFVFFLFKNKKVLIVRKLWAFIFLLATFNVLNNFFYFQAFLNTTLSNAVLTHYTAPIFVALFAPFFLAEKLDKITIPSLAISFLGLIIISYNNLSFHSQDLLGIMYGTASGVMFAFVIITIKHLSSKVNVFAINIYHSFIGAVILSFFIPQEYYFLSTKNILLLVIFALLFGITATLLHIAGIKRIKSQHAGILAYAEPFAATFFEIIFFTEIPTTNTLIGGMLIIFSGYLIVRREYENDNKAKNSYKPGPKTA